MKEYNLFGYQVEIDEAATKEWYDKADEWSCECGDCRHFVALAKKRELPESIIEVLQTFGIVPEKATYVCQMVTEEHKILYQFSYRIAGNILKEGEEAARDFGWGEVRCCHEPYPYGAPGFPTPHFDLEFWVRLPKQYKYRDIADFLMHGREIEFVYRGKECSITNHSSKWWFYDGERNIELCEFDNKELLVEKVSDIVILDKTIREIFDENCYEEPLCIL